MNRAYELSRDVTQEECNWLPRTLGKGEKVYLYTGPTYGVVGLGIPVTEKPDELPFWEVPADALEFAKPYLEAENARLKELNREMYKALLNILHLKAVDELDEELWTKAWAIGVDAIRAANGEKAEEVKGNDK